MDLSLVTPRWQRLIVLGLVAVTTVAFWTPAPDAFGLPKATLLWIGTLALAALGAARVLWERTIRLPRSPWAIAVAALVVAVVVTTLASPTLALSVVGEYNRYTGLLSYVSFAIVGLVVIRTFDVDEAALLLRGLTALVAVVGAYGLLQVLDLDPYEFGVQDIGAVGTMGNANIFAGFLAIAVPAAVWQALSETSTRGWRLAGAAVAALALAVAIGTRSFQGPGAAIPGALVVFAVWSTTDAGGRVRASIGARAGWARRAVPAIVGVCAAAGVAVSALVARDGLRDGLVERGDFWRAALSMFRSNPVLGTGFDTYGQHFLAERPEGHATRFFYVQAESAHSVPLNLLAGGGLLVAAAWLALVGLTGWGLARGLRRLEGEERLLLGGLGGAWLAYLIQAAVSFDVPALGLLHLVLAGSIIAIGWPPHWIERRLPGPVPRAVGRRGHQRQVMPRSTVIGLAVIVGATVVGMWWALRPLRADLAAGRAQEHIEAGDVSAATTSLQRATALAPWQGRYWLLRAQLAEANQEVFDAIGFAEEAARREPGSSQYALLAARLIARYRTSDEAAPLFEAALRRDPHNLEVITAVASGLAAVDADRAVELAREVERRAPNRADLLLTLGKAQLAAGDVESARDTFDRVATIEAENQTYLWEIGQAYTSAGEVTLAIAAIERSLAIESTWAGRWHALGVLYDEVGRPDDALDAYERAVELEPPNETYLAALADARARAERAR